MITLYVNDNIIDIDNDTAIGVFITTIDPYNPTTIKKASTNNFSIPKTFKNMRIFGYANNPTYTNTNAVYLDNVYDRMTFKYYYYNELIFSGLCYLDKINERINLVGYEFPDVFDWMRSISYNDFLQSYLDDYLNIKYSVPTKATASNVFLTEFRRYLSPNEFGETSQCDALQLIPSFRNEGHDYYQNYVPFGGGQIKGFWFTMLGKEENEEGSDVSPQPIYGYHFGTRFKYILEFIKQQYNAESTFGNTIDFEFGTIGSFVDSAKEIKSYLMLKGLFCDKHPSSSLYFDLSYNYIGKEEEGYKGKTLYDIFTLYLKMFNLVLDKSVSGTETTYKIRYFSEIESANIYDFNRNIDLTGLEFEPKFEGLAQKNIVKYENLPDGVNPQYKGAEIESSNKNLAYKSDMAVIPAFCGIQTAIVGDSSTVQISDNKSDKSKESFVIMQTQGYSYSEYNSSSIYFHYSCLNYNNGNFFEIADRFPTLGIPINLEDNFNFMNTFFDKPKKYKIKKFFSIQEIRDIEKWQLYYIKQLGGSFVLSEISGFNPRSPKATDVTLIKVSDLTSDIYDEFDYFVIDGEYLTIGGEKLY